MACVWVIKMREPEGKFSAMDSVLSAFVFDPTKYSQLSLGEKRELVHKIAQHPEDAPEILSSWTRQELLEIICAEMGKQRKYTGFTKIKMIEHLLKLVSKESTKNDSDDIFAFSLAKTVTGSKRQRTREVPSQPTNGQHVPFENSNEKKVKTILCQNLACRASLSIEDAFCKRCSCCICHHYDDNKDPSLWLTCNSDPPYENDSCGMSFHLKCALKDERAGIMNNSHCAKLDGRFYCVSCGKINGLMRTCRKQLLVAKEARRVDVLCLRLSLSHNILKGTEQYKGLQEIVETAVKKLDDEVGPIDRVSTEMARGIVNRLTCGAEIQKLCASAVEDFDSISSDPYSDHMNHQKDPSACRIRFEESSPTSVIIVLEYEDRLMKEFLGCRLWHRKSTLKDYPEQPTYIVLRPQKRFKVTDLSPSTNYFCKVSLFSSTSTLGVWEANWVTPIISGTLHAAIDEELKKGDITVQARSKMNPANSSGIKLTPSLDFKKLRSLDDINKKKVFHLLPCSAEDVPLASSVSPASIPPCTPCKKSGGMREVTESCGKKGISESDYDYSVRVIKWLERKGHINENFRVKFLTWFSLKATMQERRVVSAFVDTLIDDPPSLSGQLVDTFMEKICCEQIAVSRHGFCSKLRH